MGTKREAITKIIRKQYWSRDDGQAMVAAWRHSGVSLGSFAKRYGVRTERLSRWVTRFSSLPTQAHFHPVQIAALGVKEQWPCGSGELEIVLVDGRRVRVPSGFAMDDLRRLLTILEEGSRC